MKNFIYIILLTCTLLHSQQHEIDSLKNIIDNYKASDSTYIKLRNSYLNRKLVAAPTDSSLVDFANATLRIANTLDYEEGKIISHNNLGIVYQYVLSNPYKAIESYQQSLNVTVNKEKFKNHSLSTLNNIGIIYYEQQDYELAMINFKKMLLFNPNQLNAINNIGNIFGKLKQNDSAIYYYKKGVREAKRIKNNLHLGNLQSNLSVVLSKSDKLNEAINNIKSSLKLVDSLKLEFIRMPVYTNASLVYSKNSNFDKAEKYASLALNLNKSYKNLYTEKSLWETLATIYEAKEEYPKALEARKKFKILDDSISNLNKRLNITRTQIKSEAKQKQSLAEQEINKQRRLKIIYVTSGCFIICLLIIVFIWYIRKQNNNIKDKVLNTTIDTKDQLIQKKSTEHITENTIDLNRVSIPTQNGLRILEISDIIYCEANTSYTYINTKEERILVSKPLKHYETLLTDHNFFRIHNSKLINLKHVSKYTKGKGGYVTMTNNITIDVSIRKKDGFLKLIGNDNS